MNGNRPRTVAIIEARMNSSRLPGKIMMDLAGKPSLERQIERIKRAKLIDEVVIATTTNRLDDQVETWAQSLGILIYRGSEDDVLQRVLDTANAFSADIIVELTGDCPLLDPVIIDEVVRYYLDHDFDYVSNSKERSYPLGLDVKVFSRQALAEVNEKSDDPADHEHVSLYLYEHPDEYTVATLKAPQDLYAPEQRICVDTTEDYAVVKAIYENFYPQKPDFSAYDIIQFLKKNPQIANLNASVKQRPARIINS